VIEMSVNRIVIYTIKGFIYLGVSAFMFGVWASITEVQPTTVSTVAVIIGIIGFVLCIWNWGNALLESAIMRV